MNNKTDLERYKAALVEISKGRGPFKLDPLEHANSCIECMKTVAITALEGGYNEEWEDD